MRPLFLFLLLLCPVYSATAEDRAAEPEIAYLLSFIEHADVKFVRSGKEYTAQEGADHLRSKLKKAGDRVKTADDFIQGIASKSFLTGEEYKVKFPDGKVSPTGPWLQEALSRHRTKR